MIFTLIDLPAPCSVSNLKFMFIFFLKFILYFISLSNAALSTFKGGMGELVCSEFAPEESTIEDPVKES